MIYLDNGATTLHKPKAVRLAVNRALLRCANPGAGDIRRRWKRPKRYSAAGIWPESCLIVRRNGLFLP